MELVLELMEGMASAMLETPFAMTLVGLALVGAVIVVGFALSKGQESA